MKKLLLVFSLVLTAFFVQAQNAPRPELSVFPNPAEDFVMVQDNSDAVGQVIVFNFLGKKVKTFEAAKGEHYYIGDLPKGVYFVQLFGRNKLVLKTQKIEKR